MPRLTRRSFLATCAMLAARPAAGAAAAASGVDVVIVGAGAAGIAAARRIAAAGRKFVLLEASSRIGGRCITDVTTFGIPFDRGAHWIHATDVNPVIKSAPRRGIDIYPAPPSQKVRIGRRYAREGELEDFLTAQLRANHAIHLAARKGDVSCAQALPNELGDWRSTVAFMLGPFACAKDLAHVSAVDFAKRARRDADAFCRQGFGTLLASRAAGIAVELSTPVTAIDTRSGAAVETPKGTIRARTVVVTASTNVIASGAIKFTPDLSKRHLDAFRKLSLGSYDHIALEIKGGALELESDDLVFEKSSNTRTAAMLANVSGTSLCMVEVGGRFGRELAAQGEAGMVDFTAEWLAGLYGADVKKAIKRSSATRWNHEPWTRGAFSAAAPGWQSARRIVMEPIGNAIWFAGEAVHESLWGTVGGAWESGEHAAEAVLHQLRISKAAPTAEVEKSFERKSKPHEAAPQGPPQFGAAHSQ